mgnify:CR=1 FL=1
MTVPAPSISPTAPIASQLMIVTSYSIIARRRMLTLCMARNLVNARFVYGLLQSSKQLLSIRVQTRLYIRPLLQTFRRFDSDAVKRMSALEAAVHYTPNTESISAVSMYSVTAANFPSLIVMTWQYVLL